MPRGRPKKNINIFKTDVSEHKDETQKEVTQSKNKTIKVICTCSLCGKEIFSSPNIIRLQEITGKASWHRNCKTNNLCVCEKCSKELNSVIDKFLLTKNPSLSKWEN